MSDIFSGVSFKLYYNKDIGNSSPQGLGNVLINELAAMPVLEFDSSVQSYETYDSTHTTKLMGSQDIKPIDIVVNYIPDDPTHMYLDSIEGKNTETQLVLVYRDESTIDYAILNGVINASSISGDKDSVVTKTYNFTPTGVVSRSNSIMALNPLYQGDYGVGSNGDTVPQYQPVTPEGNSFIKVPAGQAQNPIGADMMGVGFIDQSNFSSMAVSSTGALAIFAKNATTPWTRILTATQIGAQYVPLTRTVNGKALSTNITLNDVDVGAVPLSRTVNGKELTSDIVLTKADVGLGNVTDDAQLKIASNLSDLDNVATARTNLSVYSKADIDTKVSNLQSSTDAKLSKASNLSDVTNVSTARTNLSLYSKAESDAQNALLVPKTTTVNGKALSTNITLTKADVVLGNVTNDAQLKIASNLSDLTNTATARVNLGLGTAAQYNIGTSGNTVPLLNSTNSWTGVQTFNAVRTNFGASITGAVGLEIGSESTAALAYIDLHSSGTNSDYDVRIYSSGGNSTVGNGNLTFSCSGVYMSNLILSNALPITGGGTGANTVSGAKTNLNFLQPGDYGIGADLTVNASTPIANLNENTPTGFYYTTNESTLGGVTSDTTYVVTNRGGRPTATASKYVQQRSWDGFYMGASGWTWKENAYMSALNPGQFRVQANGEAIRIVSTSGQPCYIMGMLSDTTDVTQRRWYFGNGGDDNTVVMYNSRTNSSMVLADAGNAYIQARSNSTGSGTAYTTQFQSNGTIIGPLGTVTQTSSDIRLKSNVIEAKDGALERINKIGCVEFTWDNEERRDRGFIAQQLADIDELYTYKPNEDGYLNYSSTALMSDTFGAIQELTRIKDDQASRIETLESTIQNQQLQIDTLKELVQQQINK